MRSRLPSFVYPTIFGKLIELFARRAVCVDFSRAWRLASCACACAPKRCIHIVRAMQSSTLIDRWNDQSAALSSQFRMLVACEACVDPGVLLQLSIGLHENWIIVGTPNSHNFVGFGICFSSGPMDRKCRIDFPNIGKIVDRHAVERLKGYLELHALNPNPRRSECAYLIVSQCMFKSLQLLEEIEHDRHVAIECLSSSVFAQLLSQFRCFYGLLLADKKSTDDGKNRTHCLNPGCGVSAVRRSESSSFWGKNQGQRTNRQYKPSRAKRQGDGPVLEERSSFHSLSGLSARHISAPKGGANFQGWYPPGGAERRREPHHELQPLMEHILRSSCIPSQGCSRTNPSTCGQFSEGKCSSPDRCRCSFLIPQSGSWRTLSVPSRPASLAIAHE
ncbi:hypothetical protein LMG26840_02201 [Achromobacter dolens]|nr:hypothetical protein LMG26840_02201 [Achromobacter dolens]